MPKSKNSNLKPFAAAVAIALTVAAVATRGGSMLAPSAALADTTAKQGQGQWAASATGRVEPKDGEIRIGTQVPGLIAEVPVKTNDQVQAGDLLVKLDDDDLRAKLLSARVEAEVREREREDEPVTKGLALDRRKAQDDVAKAERAVFSSQQALDTALGSLRSGSGKPDDVSAARTKLATARTELTTKQAELAKVEESADLPLLTRLETALEQSRYDLLQIETAIEKTRIRAPSDGTVLNVMVRPGELAAPSPDAPLLTFGDVSSLRVRAELEEREVVKVRAGQSVVVRVDAYPDRDFPGTVSSIAASLGAPRIVARGPRRPSDVEVLEVLVALDGQPPLLTGMRVDVFFTADSGQQSAVVDGAKK